MTGPAYPAARLAAIRVHPHFSAHMAADADAQAFLPDASTMEAIIDAAFWASLRRQEGYTPKISLAWIPPERAGQPLQFARPLPLSPDNLSRLAPAVERPGIHLGIWGRDGALHVWGTTRTIPISCFVLEVLNPGMLVVKHRRGEEAGKFVNVATLEGEVIKVLNREVARVVDCPPMVTALLGFETPDTPDEPVNIQVELAVSMRAHGKGGALLVVPSNSREWRESIVRPVAHAVSPPYSELAFLIAATPEERRERWWHDALRRAVDAVAGLTAVDGATIINDGHEVLAFGAKIARRQEFPQVENVVLNEPVEGSTPSILNPSQLGGTRHLSAAQFVQDQRNVLALVASQDGRFTVFAWSPRSEKVHAHRVETLLV